jgi:endonuclease-3
LFYVVGMQAVLPFPSPPQTPLAQVRERLLARYGPQRSEVRLDPVTQLVKGCLAVRASEDAARAALARVRAAYPDWADLAEAAPEAVEPLLAGLVDAERKARQVPLVLRAIMRQRGPIYLDFLAYLPVDRAMEWLTALPGVGPVIAAAVLNQSTLNRPALVADAAVTRIAKRYGLVGRTADAQAAYEALNAMIPKRWIAADFNEFHALLRKLAHGHCTAADPACGRCPLAETCRKVDVGGGQVVAMRRTPGMLDAKADLALPVG